MERGSMLDGGQMMQQDGRNPRTRGHVSKKPPLSSGKSAAPGSRKRRISNISSVAELQEAAPSNQVATPSGDGKQASRLLWISPSNSVRRELSRIDRSTEEALERHKRDSVVADDLGDFQLFSQPEYSRALTQVAALDGHEAWEESTQIPPGWDSCNKTSGPHCSQKRPRNSNTQNLDRCNSVSRGCADAAPLQQAAGSCISVKEEASFGGQGVESCEKPPSSAAGEGCRFYSRDLPFSAQYPESCGRASSLAGGPKSGSCTQVISLTRRRSSSRDKGDFSILKEPGSCCKSTARAEHTSCMSVSNIEANPESQAGHSSRTTIPYPPLDTHASLDFSFELPPVRLEAAYGWSRPKHASSLAGKHDAGQEEGDEAEIMSQPLPGSLRVKTSRQHSATDSDQSGQITPDLSHPEPSVKFHFGVASSSQDPGGPSQEGEEEEERVQVRQEHHHHQHMFPLMCQTAKKKVLCIIRHGESTFNQADARDKSFSDPLIFDPPLTELGHKQARRLRPQLKALLATYGRPLWVISPLTRAIQTFLDACPEAIASQPSAPNKQPAGRQPTSGQQGHTAFQAVQAGQGGGTASLKVVQQYGAEEEEEEVSQPGQAEAAGSADVEFLPLISEYLRTAGDVGRPASLIIRDFPHLSAQLSKLPEYWWHTNPDRPNCALDGTVGSLEGKDSQKSRLSEFLRWLGSKEESFIVMVGHAAFWKSFLPSHHSLLANGEMVLLSW